MSEKNTEMVSLETKAGLLEYLKRAIALESSMVTQKQVIDDYEESSKRREPILNLEAEREYPKSSTNLSSFAIISLLFGVIMLILGVLALPFPHLRSGSGIGMVFAIGGCACLPFIFSIPGLNREDESYRGECELVKSMNERIREKNSEKEAQYQNAMSEWRDSNEKAHEYFSKPLSETQAVLDKLYSVDVIYPKYRTLPALTSIYEYLVTGRCEELSGAHGAYNLYEDEIRKDTIISQLNTVIENLEQIKQNQYMLYEQVKGIQQNTRAIAAELYQIKGYAACLTDLAALTAFYSGVAATNTSTLSYCRLLG